MRQNRRHYRYLVTILFNIFLFYLLYLWLQRNIHLHSLLVDIEETKLSSVIPIFFFYFIITCFYGMRLALLLRTEFRQSFYITSIGNGLNNILPFRLGDFLRVYFARRFFDIDMPHTFAATFMERYFDLIVLLILGSVILLNVEYGFEINAVYLFIILLSCSLISLLLYRYLIVKDTYLKSWVCRSERIKLLLQAVEDVVSTRNKLRVFLLTLVIWSCLLLVYYVFFSVNLNFPAINVMGAVFLLFTTTLSFAVPYSFAGIGIFEAAIVYDLIKYAHVVPTKALALALVFHFTVAAPQVVAMALVFLLLSSPIGRVVSSERM